MENFDIKKLIQEMPDVWCEFNFDVVYSNNGVARIYIGNRRTQYSASGCGYDKESSVIALMINDLIGEQKYKKGVYGHYNGLLHGGTGFSSIKESFETKKGCKLECI